MDFFESYFYYEISNKITVMDPSRFVREYDVEYSRILNLKVRILIVCVFRKRPICPMYFLFGLPDNKFLRVAVLQY